MQTATMFSSKSDNWATPQSFYEDLDREFNFNLDPCADSQNHKCENYYTAEDDGLSQNWGVAKSSVIRLTAILRRGLRRLTGKDARTILLLCC